MNEKNISASGFVEDLRDAAGRNPVSAALIGMGVLWMLTGAKSPAGVRRVLRNAGLDQVPDALSEVRSGLREKAGSDVAASTLEAARGRGASVIDDVVEYGRAMIEPGAVFETARDGLSELFRAQPLALGAIGLAIGAGIAAALPKTDVEDAYLGEASRTLKTEAAEIAGQQVEKATALANDVVEAASAEARKQGLTPDGAKAATNDLTGRVGRVVDAAKNSVGVKQKQF
jgi:hypothetical protein